jgi:hypothetical protein
MGACKNIRGNYLPCENLVSSLAKNHYGAFFNEVLRPVLSVILSMFSSKSFHSAATGQLDDFQLYAGKPQLAEIPCNSTRKAEMGTCKSTSFSTTVKLFLHLHLIGRDLSLCDTRVCRRSVVLRDTGNGCHKTGIRTHTSSFIMGQILTKTQGFDPLIFYGFCTVGCIGTYHNIRVYNNSDLGVLRSGGTHRTNHWRHSMAPYPSSYNGSY